MQHITVKASSSLPRLTSCCCFAPRPGSPVRFVTDLSCGHLAQVMDLHGTPKCADTILPDSMSCRRMRPFAKTSKASPYIASQGLMQGTSLMTSPRVSEARPQKISMQNSPLIERGLVQHGSDRTSQGISADTSTSGFITSRSQRRERFSSLAPFQLEVMFAYHLLRLSFLAEPDCQEEELPALFGCEAAQGRERPTNWEAASPA